MLDVLGCFQTCIEINSILLEVLFYIIPSTAMNDICLLGRDVLCNSKIKVIIDKGKVAIEKSEFVTDFVENKVLKIDVCDTIRLNIEVNEKLNFCVKNEIEQNLIQNYIKPERPINPITDLKMKLLVDSNHIPFYFTPRRLSYADKLEVDKIIDNFLSRGIIRESSSQYSSPIVLVKRRSGKLRLCVDYRVLNKLTTKDNFPMPLIDDQIEKLKDKKFFTRLDLKDAFHHVTIDDESVKYTSFVTPSGQYEYLKMPFGLKNSSATFIRFLNTAFRNLISQNKVIIYVDDIVISSSGFKHTHFATR